MNYFSKSLISIAEMTNGTARLVQFFNHNPEDTRAERRETTINISADETRSSLFSRLNDDQNHVIAPDGSLKMITFATV